MKYNFFISIFCFVILQTCSSQKLVQKINGISYVASRVAIDSTHTQPVVEVNANYAAIMPFGFIRDINNPTIIHNTDRQWYGETRVGAKHYIDELRKVNVKIMLKPQIWISHGEFTGYLEMKNEEDWKILEDSYADFIMEYANLAQETQSEIFCIGTELEAFIKNRPEYWRNLIHKIQAIYSGKLTYAANWDEYKRVPFWEELDYIGIDAYFPTSESKTPTVEECMEGWQNHLSEIKSIAENNDRPILFTEYGYRSMDYSAKEPWNSDHKIKGVNLEAQTNATEALLETFWDKEWFAGGFVWKWFHHHNEVGGKKDNQFTPQNKPVEDVIRSFYSSKLN